MSKKQENKGSTIGTAGNTRYSMIKIKFFKKVFDKIMRQI